MCARALAQLDYKRTEVQTGWLIFGVALQIILAQTGWQTLPSISSLEAQAWKCTESIHKQF